MLSLWDVDAFTAEVGQAPGGRAGPDHALPQPRHHRRCRPRARAGPRGRRPAGQRRPSERDWGGYSGYFADPDGFRWEICFNPGPIGQEVLP